MLVSLLLLNFSVSAQSVRIGGTYEGTIKLSKKFRLTSKNLVSLLLSRSLIIHAIEPSPKPQQGFLSNFLSIFLSS